LAGSSTSGDVIDASKAGNLFTFTIATKKTLFLPQLYYPVEIWLNS
jgi:hypothetical protein